MSSIQILEPENYSVEALETYESLATIRFGIKNQKDNSEVVLLVTRLGVSINKRLLDWYPNLKCVATVTTGFSHIDMSECETRGILVLSLNDCKESLKQITATAELTIGLMLALVRHIPESSANVNSGFWDRDKFIGTQLYKKSIGVIGLGRLGSMVARFCLALGMKVLAHDPAQNNPNFSELGIKNSDFRTVMMSADIITIHANESEKNVNLINRETIKLMKDGSYLVNTARGSLVNERDVVEALGAGKIRGLAVDVISDEVNISRSPLVQAAKNDSRILITPHIGGCTHESMRYTEILMAKKIKSIWKMLT